MTSDQTGEMKVVFTGHSWEAQLLKNILENEGIPAWVTDEAIGTLVPFLTTPGMGAVKLRVAGSNFEKAKAIASEFEENRKEGS